jgi:hypothetical protein
MTDDTDEPPLRAHRRPWTPEDDAQLADLRQGDHPDEVIGYMMHRTGAAVQARVSKLKARGIGDAIPSRKREQWTPERVGQARALRSQGLTMSQVAIRLRSDAATVGRALRRCPETTESSPSEGVRVARTMPSLQRAETEVAQARAALARAEARHREAMEPILTAVGRAVRMARLSAPESEGDPAQLLLASLRSQGIELRVRS